MWVNISLTLNRIPKSDSDLLDLNSNSGRPHIHIRFSCTLSQLKATHIYGATNVLWLNCFFHNVNLHRGAMLASHGAPLLHNESSQHQTLADLFGPVKRSIDTNSLSHFLMCPPPNTTTLLGFLDSCSSDSHTTALSHCHPAPTRLRTFQCLEPVSPNNRPHSDAVLHQLQVHSTAAGQGRERPDDLQLSPVNELQRWQSMVQTYCIV